jgi:hypothetical protein
MKIPEISYRHSYNVEKTSVAVFAFLDGLFEGRFEVDIALLSEAVGFNVSPSKHLSVFQEDFNEWFTKEVTV